MSPFFIFLMNGKLGKCRKFRNIKNRLIDGFCYVDNSFSQHDK